MADAVQGFTELLEGELPEWLPRPEAPLGADVAWFLGRRELQGFEVYVCRVGDGGAPPFAVTLLSCLRREQRADVPGVACWPSLEDIWAAIDETCLEGGMFQLPAHLSGAKFRTSLEGQAVTIVQAIQVGAIAGTAAHVRFSIASKAPRLVQ